VSRRSQFIADLYLFGTGHIAVLKTEHRIMQRDICTYDICALIFPYFFVYLQISEKVK